MCPGWCAQAADSASISELTSVLESAHGCRQGTALGGPHAMPMRFNTTHKCMRLLAEQDAPAQLQCDRAGCPPLTTAPLIVGTWLHAYAGGTGPCMTAALCLAPCFVTNH